MFRFEKLFFVQFSMLFLVNKDHLIVMYNYLYNNYTFVLFDTTVRK